MIRVLLADGHRAFVEALALRLDTEPGLHVVAAVTGADAAQNAARARPVDDADLAAEGAEPDFLALGRSLRAESPRLALVAVSGGDDVATVARAVRHGFRGWVPKDVGVSALLEVIRAVCRGETRIPPLLLTRLLESLLRDEGGPRTAAEPLSLLTARELEVLRAMSSGASRQEIAEQLEISPHTVRTHMQSILAKLDVHTSLAAVTLARRGGLE